MSGRLRIAQVTTSGMALRFLLLDQLQMLKEMGHEVISVCSPGPWVQELRQMGLPVETVSMRCEPSIRADMRSLLALHSLFKLSRFDVVHTHTPKAGLLGPLAARMAGVPVVLHTIHGLMFHDRQSPARQALYWVPERFTAACADRLLSQSREDVGRAVRSHLCGSEKIRWIGNGIDLRRFSRDTVDGAAVRRELGLKDDDFVIGSVGRLVVEKGLGELFAAAQHLRPKYPKLRLLVVGFEEHNRAKSVPSESLAAMVRSGTVVFAGARTDMPRCYAAMDLLVHPSHREGVPRACLEASAMELPVIASDIRGCREVIVPGQTGLLVPVRCLLALAGAVERLMLNNSLRRAMGTAGREFISANFDHRFVLRRVAEVYREIEHDLRGKTVAARAG